MEKISRLIADHVGPRKYQVWFKNSTRLRLDGDHLQVSVPNQFIGQWIEKHFADDIATAAGQVLAATPQVHTIVDPTLFANLRKRQLDHQANSVTKQMGRAMPPQRNNGNGYNGNGNGHAKLKFSLDQFIVGESNKMAYNCARDVVEAPGTKFNPLFVHGGCGLGKTHLLQGICAALNDNVRWLYVSAEEFTNQFLWAIRAKKLDQFRARFRRLDVLVIDDVHFLSDKHHTQQEFLHTFNEISTGGRQVVMASDAHPKLIGQLAEPLVNRFVSGMVARIDKPDRATRKAILKRRAAKLGLHVTEDVIDFIADNVEDNVRELEGALLKLLAYRSVEDGEMNLGRVRTMLSDHISTVSPAVKLGDVESMVSTYFGLRPADLHSSRKSRTVSTARSVAMYLARKLTGLSYPDIGKYMGNKNHATVIQACRRIDKKLAEDLVLEWVTSEGPVEQPAREVVDQFQRELDQ